MTIRTGQFNNDDNLNLNSKELQGVSSIRFSNGTTTFTAADVSAINRLATATDRGAVRIDTAKGIKLDGESLTPNLGDGLELVDGKIKLKVNGGNLQLTGEGLAANITTVDGALTYGLMKQKLNDPEVGRPASTDLNDIFKFSDLTYARLKSAATEAGQAAKVLADLEQEDFILRKHLPTATQVDATSVNNALAVETFSPRDVAFKNTNSGRLVLNEKGIFLLVSDSSILPQDADAGNSLFYLFNQGDMKVKSLTINGRLLDESSSNGGILSDAQKKALTGGVNSDASPASGTFYHHHDSRYARLSSPAFTGTATFASISSTGNITSVSGNVSGLNLQTGAGKTIWFGGSSAVPHIYHGGSSFIFLNGSATSDNKASIEAGTVLATTVLATTVQLGGNNVKLSSGANELSVKTVGNADGNLRCYALLTGIVSATTQNNTVSFTGKEGGDNGTVKSANISTSNLYFPGEHRLVAATAVTADGVSAGPVLLFQEKVSGVYLNGNIQGKDLIASGRVYCDQGTSVFYKIEAQNGGHVETPLIRGTSTYSPASYLLGVGSSTAFGSRSWKNVTNTGSTNLIYLDGNNLQSRYVTKFLRPDDSVNSNGLSDIWFEVAYGNYASPSADVAEAVPTADDSIEAGDVLEIASQDESVCRSSGGQYSLTVAGVSSTAPALLLGDRHREVSVFYEKNNGDESASLSDESRAAATPAASAPVALAGRVPCKVTTKYIDAEGKEIRRPIKKGFMLVSSSIPGHAMAADPSDKGGQIPQGTVLGKAMQDWDPAEDESQEGVIKVWVNLC